MKKTYSIGLISIVLFTGCSVTPHVNISDSDIMHMSIDSTDVDFSKKMKKSTHCVNPRSLDGELTIMKAAQEGGIKKVKYVTKEDHFTTQRTLFSGIKTLYTQKCITVYGE